MGIEGGELLDCVERAILVAETGVDHCLLMGEPEVLVYHTGDEGTLVLGAVEWVVPKARWEEAGHTDPPVVFGHSLHVLNPALNWYVAHAWIWTNNPGGMFADWNPSVTVPDRGGRQRGAALLRAALHFTSGAACSALVTPGGSSMIRIFRK